MSGWSILTGCGICATGAVLFLKLVADEMEYTESGLRQLEQHERRAYKQRIEARVAARPPAVEKTA